jgi:ADP-ribosylglycohydrolase
MIGSILGDVIGSIYEFDNIHTENFELFSHNSTYTDDTIMTIATANAILNKSDYKTEYINFGKKYPTPFGCYGYGFKKWLNSDNHEPYNSYGNGSAMRVSPVGFAFESIEEVLIEAKKSAEITHNHIEGIKGAQAVAVAIFLAKHNRSKENIKEIISNLFDYNLNRNCKNIKQNYSFDETCQGTVPEAIIAFLESNSFENAIRKAVSLGGDSDTLTCITGGIAQAYYKTIPKEIIQKGLKTIPIELLNIINRFNSKIGYELK